MILNGLIGMLFILEVQVRLRQSRSTTHPKFNPTEVRTNDFQIINSTFHVPEMLVLKNNPDGSVVKTGISGT